MKTASRWFFAAAGALAGVLALPADAYDQYATHPTLTVISAQKSAITQDPTLLFRLGLSSTSPEDIGYLMAHGAVMEDEGSRALNHFFDPVSERPLWVCNPLLPRCTTSWQWMTEASGPIEGQDNSLADARADLQKALTYNEGDDAIAAQVRNLAMGALFESLGHTVHHMQDMAQPQHVRDDDHLDEYRLWGLNPRYRPSLYEKYTKEQILEERLPVYALGDTATPVFPDSAEFKTARDFWFNASKTGIAQYTNRSFVSAGTNFRISFGQAQAGKYPEPELGPSTDYTVEELYAGSNLGVPPEISALCGTPAVNCNMTMYSAGASSRASTLSIFDQHMKARGVSITYNSDADGTPTYVTERLFALNRFNFDDAHPQLIPKAVSYSAGLINHFFRGKITVEPPAQGAYAVVDHSTGAGFTTLRAKVTNATPGEALSNGFITAIARFHRNNCYKPDLSGEFTMDEAGEPVAPCPNYRSDEEHIRVATPQAISLADKGSQELTFAFPDAIPVDATDLILQVYYQGTVGAEEQSFALGAVDISEPTFVAIMNATDVFELPTSTGNQFFYYKDIINNVAVPPYNVVDLDHNGKYSTPPDVPVQGGNINYTIYVDGQKVGTTTLSEGRFARLAVLVKPTGFVLTLDSRGAGFYETDVYNKWAKQNQLDPVNHVYTVSAVYPLRKQTKQFVGVVFSMYYPTSSAPLSVMPPSMAADATTPVAITMVDAVQQPAPLIGMQRPQSTPQASGKTRVQMTRSQSFRVHAKPAMDTTAVKAPAAPPL